jgi:hypothetical protein
MVVATSIGMVSSTHGISADALPAVGGCPGLAANVTLSDYDGTHTAQLCVAPGGFNVNGGTVNLHAYDAASDGIFHYGFDALD